MLLSEGEGEPSTRRVLCVTVTLLCCVLCLLGLKYGIDGGVKDLATMMLTITFGAMTAGRFAEAIERKNND
jgi:hypothetical protein